ncbi:TlpA family protein disulfide reductase [Psychroserpens sp. BH13MA-6]
MKYLIYIGLLCVTMLWSKSDVPRDVHTFEVPAKVDDLKVLNFEELQNYLATKDDSKTYVINFWATWCAPCVKELPYFEKLQATYNVADVEVILVSLDFPRQIESKLKPFLEKHQLESEVLVLNDVDSNSWIPKVDENWSGAIPATIIYNKHKRLFFEQSFTYKELETELQPFLK